MTMQAYWHIDDDHLMGWSGNIQERIDYIRAQKPAHEVEIQLRWMTPVQGELPREIAKTRAAHDEALAASVIAAAAYGEVMAASNKAYIAYAKATYDEARAAHARAAYDEVMAQLAKVQAAFKEAGAAGLKASGAFEWALVNCQSALEALHTAEHPGCPWDGKTLFPEVAP